MLFQGPRDLTVRILINREAQLFSAGKLSGTLAFQQIADPCDFEKSRGLFTTLPCISGNIYDIITMSKEHNGAHGKELHDKTKGKK